MSHRPIHAKKVAKLRKLMRTTLPAHIDLVDFLVTRGHAPSKRVARELIASGKVRVGSHKLTEQIQPARLRKEITVLDG